MKSRIIFISGLFLALGFTSCVEDDVITTSNQLVKTISVTGQDFQSEEAVTKATYTVDGTGMHFSWTEGDTVGIYPVGGDQVAFPISSGEGSQTAQFDGGAWALRSSYSYAAYYPFEKGNYMVDETQISVSFIGQIQKGIGSLDCLDRFDYQASVATCPDADGNVNIELKHLGCFVRFQLKMPVTDTYKSITLKSSKTPFVTSGTFDLTSNSIQITPVTTSQTISIALNNTSTTEQDSVLVVYAMIAPVDMSDSNIDITIYGTKDSVYTMSVPGKKMLAGKAYSYNTGISPTEYQLSIEREALIAIYNALDGDHWTEKENWCSDKPVGEWKNVTTNPDGTIYSLDIYFIGASGDIPAQIGDLTNLERLRIGDSEISSIPPQIGNLANLIALDIGGHEIITVPKEIDNLINLQDLHIWGGSITEVQPNFESFPLLEDVNLNLNGTTDFFPAGLANSPILWRIACTGGRFTAFPESIRGMKQLESLSFLANMQNVTIPDWLGELTNLTYLGLGRCGLVGEIPSSLGNLNKLEQLTLLDNSLTGTIPDSFSGLTRLTELNISGNLLTGKIPDCIVEMPWFKYRWGELIESNQFDISDLTLYAPEFTVTDINGTPIIAKDIYCTNKFTILMNWCPGENLSTTNTMLQLFDMYKNYGVDMIAWTDTDDRVEAIRPSNTPWHNFLYTHPNNYFYRSIDPYCEILNYPRWYRGYPSIVVVDSNSKVVWSNLLSTIELEQFLAENIDLDVDWYVSTDYSMDGEVAVIQQSTSDAGIDLILMGDAFSDRQIADGIYDGVVQSAIDAFFSEEPFKSFKNLFNVYSVNVVSATEGYNHSGQALGTVFDGGTHVYGNDAKVLEYAKKAIPESKLDDAVIAVIMNKDAYAGTCYFYNAPDGNYGRGTAVAYIPTNSIPEYFDGLVLHEVGGHGFAKLADEYAYESNGTVTQDVVNKTKTNEQYGWWKNVDFTNNIEQVKWSTFINDSRYASENIGCYEGGLTYWSGVWRPTENSIMRYNTGGFNAPSRYAIWYRINKLAYGVDWNGTYEDFVSYDVINRTSSATSSMRSQSRRNYVEKPLPPLAPPVVVGHSWREAK